MKKPISQLSRITNYVKANPFSKASDIQKGLNFKGNIYTLLGVLTDKNIIRKMPNKEYVLDLRSSPTSETKVNPMIKMLQDEIDHIQNGIDQLMITKNYLERRLEQLED